MDTMSRGTWQKACLAVAAASLVCATLFVGSQALGDVSAKNDSDDASGRLDIKKISHEHSSSGRVLHRLTTFERWRARQLRCRGNLHFVFPDQHRDVRVTFRNGTLIATILNTNNGAVVGSGKVFRPSRRSVEISLRRKFFGSVDSYRWSVHSEWLSACPNDGGDPISHLDRAPNKGSIASHL